MKSWAKVLMALLCSSLFCGTPFGSLAADKIPAPPSKLGITSGTVSPAPVPPPPVPVTPPGNDGLLSGMTPGSYKIPSGWSLIRTQDFESGVPSSEWLEGGSVSNARAHTGNYAARGYYASDGSELKWGISGTNPTGTYTELYISFYEWTDSNARFNVEYIFGSNASDYEGGYHRINFNYFDTGVFNGTSAPYIIQGEGTAMDAYAIYGPYRKIPVGRWVQREIWHRPNTPKNSDGFLRIYEDGNLVHRVENANTNGPVDMRAGSWIMVGGVYTAHIWRKENGSCGEFPGDGTGYERQTNWDACICPNQCPPDGKIPKFYRHLDDIIVMKR